MNRANGMNVRSVAITGASSGIGHATALAFARRGCNVAICARSGEALSVVAEEIEAEGGRALSVVADVSKYDDVQRFAAEALAAFGAIDVWINNASVAEWGLFEELDPAGMERVVAVDLLGTMYGARAILPHFRQRRGGVIINVASGLAERAVPLLSTYCAAKAGVKGFTDALRMEQRAAKSGIEVVMILPASINTPFYSWGRSRLGVRPHPISVIYPPHVVAEAIVRAARRPQREVYVGAMSKVLSMAQRLSPAMTDRYMLFRDQMIRQQFSDRVDEGESNLFSTPDDARVEGDFGSETRATSLYTRAFATRPAVRRVAIAAVVVGALAAITRPSRARRRRPARD
jgi:short-subunit dehydrogenase